MVKAIKFTLLIFIIIILWTFINGSIVYAAANTLVTVDESYFYFYSHNEFYSSLIYFSLAIIFIYFKSLTPIISPFAVFVFLLISLIAVSLLLFFMVILLWDKFYRPNVPQYPYNVFIDRVIPTTLLISLAITIYFLSSYFKGLFCIMLLIILHTCVIVPIIHYWSQLRNWDLASTNTFAWSWGNPRLYKHLSIALIYPLIWGSLFHDFTLFTFGTRNKLSYNL